MVKVTMTFSSNKLDNLAMLGARTSNLKGFWSLRVDDREKRSRSQ